MIVFACLYAFHPKTSQVVERTTITVTNEVVKEVPKEVVKEVEKLVSTPTPISDDYRIAMELFKRMTNAPYVGRDKILFNMKEVRLACYLDDSVQEAVSTEQIKAKFELVLRRNNVPISSESKNVVTLNISGFWDSAKSVLTESTTTSVREPQMVMREGEFRQAAVKVWENGVTYGTVGKLKASDMLLNEAEKAAELFANDFLNANPKKSEPSQQ
jgi:hypothetical protein